ncbi:Uncharacterized protein LW93_11808 [Fusarium fujikuroi]|nr:Uncharacterized protein LW93_11808 [Fusarium fujikuroi]
MFTRTDENPWFRSPTLDEICIGIDATGSLNLILIPAHAGLLSSLSSTQGGVFEKLRRHHRSTFPSLQVLATLGLTDAKIVFIFLLLFRPLALTVHSPVPFAHTSHLVISNSMTLPTVRPWLCLGLRSRLSERGYTARYLYALHRLVALLLYFGFTRCETSIACQSIRLDSIPFRGRCICIAELVGFSQMRLGTHLLIFPIPGVFMMDPVRPTLPQYRFHPSLLHSGHFRSKFELSDQPMRAGLCKSGNDGKVRFHKGHQSKISCCGVTQTNHVEIKVKLFGDSTWTSQ